MEERFGLKYLRGSNHFAHFYQGPLSFVVILDLVGGVFAPSFEPTYLQFGSALPPLKHPELEFLDLPLRILEPLGPTGARSDYHGFRKRGIPFTFLTSGTPWYYHTKNDTPEILKFPKMASFVETLGTSLLAAPSPGSDGSSDSFWKFLQKIQSSPLLSHPFIQDLLQKKTEPSRTEILRIYWYLLPRLRALGPRAWTN
jgi:hypothetical protein